MIDSEYNSISVLLMIGWFVVFALTALSALGRNKDDAPKFVIEKLNEETDTWEVVAFADDWIDVRAISQAKQYRVLDRSGSRVMDLPAQRLDSLASS